MIDAEFARTMAAYNRWMNERAYAVCSRVADAERRRDRGAFFGSIHGTLNHLVYADLAFLSRFTGDPPEVPALGTELYAGFEELAAVRAALDARLIAWAAGLSEEWLASPFTYTSTVDGLTRTLPAWILVGHLFNHQAHHRGQLSTLLTQAGHDIGVTDLPFMPGVARIVVPEPGQPTRSVGPRR
jgi:uncharacterized damage-inducible protein DinB